MAKNGYDRKIKDDELWQNIDDFYNNCCKYNINRFASSQQHEISDGISDPLVSLDVVKIYANPYLNSYKMRQIKIGAQNGLTRDQLIYLFKFANEKGNFLGYTRELLEKNIVDMDFLDSIFTENGEVISTKYLNTNNFKCSIEAVDQIEILHLINIYANNNLLDKFREYIDNHSLKDVREFLFLCTKLKLKDETEKEFEEKVTESLVLDLPVNIIFCFYYHNKTNKSWSEVVDFFKIHINARYYIRAFLGGYTDSKTETEIKRLFRVKSNRLIDLLYFSNNVDVCVWSVFSEYGKYDTNKPMDYLYSGYSSGKDEKLEELARVISKLFANGRTSQEIADIFVPESKHAILTMYFSIACQVNNRHDVMLIDKICHKFIGKKISKKIIDDMKDKYLSVKQ